MSSVSPSLELKEGLWVVCVYIKGGGAMPLLGKWCTITKRSSLVSVLVFGVSVAEDVAVL